MLEEATKNGLSATVTISGTGGWCCLRQPGVRGGTAGVLAGVSPS